MTTVSFRHRGGGCSPASRMAEAAICQIAKARDYPGLRNIIPILRTSPDLTAGNPQPTMGTEIASRSCLEIFQ